MKNAVGGCFLFPVRPRPVFDYLDPPSRPLSGSLGPLSSMPWTRMPSKSAARRLRGLPHGRRAGGAIPGLAAASGEPTPSCIMLRLRCVYAGLGAAPGSRARERGVCHGWALVGASPGRAESLV